MPILGLVGTLVRDRIHPPGGAGPVVESWGGITYSLAAARAALDDDWVLRPLLKVGQDVADGADALLVGFDGLDAGSVRTVTGPGNRVDLHYTSESERTERLSGGVPPWSAEELLAGAAGCDALYVNFISGMEADLEAAAALSAAFDGPLYADLHSLFLGVAPDGLRVPQPLEAWDAWFDLFDAVQLNEEELASLRASGGDPRAAVGRGWGGRTRLVVVTRGSEGVSWLAPPDAALDPWGWGEPEPAGGTPVWSRVPASGVVRPSDPTGCGDVWGATFFARLLSGDDLAPALERAQAAAAVCAGRSGTEGLREALETAAVAGASPGEPPPGAAG